MAKKTKKPKRSESINWIDCDEQRPDTDTTVLLFVPDADDPVWLGYWDVNEWLYVDGSTVDDDVTHWAHLPAGPEPDCECSDCGEKVHTIIGCPDGAEICQACFDAGGH